MRDGLDPKPINPKQFKGGTKGDTTPLVSKRRMAKITAICFCDPLILSHKYASLLVFLIIKVTLLYIQYIGYNKVQH